MTGLTTQELVILIIIIVAIAGIVGLIVRKSIKLIATVATGFVLVSLLVFWLPGKVQMLINGETTVQETIDAVQSGKENAAFGSAIKSGANYVEDNYVSWGEALNSLMKKIFFVHG